MQVFFDIYIYIVEIIESHNQKRLLNMMKLKTSFDTICMYISYIYIYEYNLSTLVWQAVAHMGPNVRPDAIYGDTDIVHAHLYLHWQERPEAKGQFYGHYSFLKEANDSKIADITLPATAPHAREEHASFEPQVTSSHCRQERQHKHDAAQQHDTVKEAQPAQVSATPQTPPKQQDQHGETSQHLTRPNASQEHKAEPEAQAQPASQQAGDAAQQHAILQEAQPAQVSATPQTSPKQQDQHGETSQPGRVRCCDVSPC